VAVRVYVAVVVTAAVAIAAATAGAVPVGGRDLAQAGVLAGAAWVSTELMRRVERQREYLRADGTAYVDTKGVWSMAALVVLPPALASAMVVWTYAIAWFRVWPSARPVLLYRWVFACATVLLGTQAAAAVLAIGMSSYPGPPATGWWSAPADLAVIVVALAVRWAFNCGLVMAAIAVSSPGTRTSALFRNFSQQWLEAGSAGLGLVAAVLVVTHPLVLAGVVAGLAVMYRGVLLHQFQVAARTDSKTGLATVACGGTPVPRARSTMPVPSAARWAFW